MNTIILVDTDVESFYRSVSTHLSCGWKCLGLPIIDGQKIQQEMVFLDEPYHSDPAINELLKKRDLYGWNY